MDFCAFGNFSGQDPGELTFKKGDIITNVEPSGSVGWFTGTLNGNTGRFPAPFVRMIENTSSGSSEVNVCPETSTISLNYKNINKYLQCLNCFEIPEEKIYQCTSEHTVCQKCSLSLTACPLCRSQLIRNRAVESLLSQMTILCPFSKEGCTVRTLGSQITLHKADCKYNPNIVQLCRFFGYKCTFWSDVTSHEKTIAHLKDHKCMHHSGNSIILQYTNFNCKANKDIMESRNENYGLWTPVTLKTNKCSFLLVSKTWKHDQFQLMTWACVQLNKNYRSSEVEFVVITPNSKKARTLKWTETPVKLLQLKLEDSPFGIPMKNLEKSYTDENKNLAVLVTIQKHCAALNGLQHSEPKRIILGDIE